VLKALSTPSAVFTVHVDGPSRRVSFYRAAVNTGRQRESYVNLAYRIVSYKTCLAFTEPQTEQGQSETEDFDPVPTPDELDETYTSSSILAHLVHYMNT